MLSLHNKVPQLKKNLVSVNQFIDYMWTHLNAKIRYRASEKILSLHSDASYLIAPKAQSHAGGYFFLGSILQDTELIFINGTIHFTCTILKLVAASANEAELGAFFPNAQGAKVIQLVLKELRHLQPPTPIHIYNTTSVGIINNTTKRHQSWAMKMRFSGYLTVKSKNYSISTTNLVKRT
jgi:hypothetical protein